MKHFLKVFALFLALSWCPGAHAQGPKYDVLIPISKYLAQGDAESLSAWFADNLEISILNSTGTSSKSQAKQIVKSFFSSYTPRSFDLSHTAGKESMKYALGTMNAGGETFLVTLFISSKGDTYRIQQLKIERLQ